jgi:mono/diheme cytochrome c family protein
MLNGRVIGVCLLVAVAADVRADEAYFREHVAPILSRHCVICHNSEKSKGDLSLQSSAKALAGGESGEVILPGKPDKSILIEYITGPKPEMPKKRTPLSAEQVGVLRKWIADGAAWPKGMTLKKQSTADSNWWSLLPIVRHDPPKLTGGHASKARTPIDRFLLARLKEKGLTFSPEADRRTLVRRLYFDLLGIPPTLAQIEKFVANKDPRAYERLVDELLASPRYGERWARHWLDVVHYGDTHGYDKDKLRPNAWPYRDYVIRSLNDDKPYGRFVKEQLAGDVLYPNSPDGITATGFLAAGPWDWVGHQELREGTIDKKITRNLDRDDMVASTMNTFVSMTAQCARCHDHKFDPISQKDYYGLQAVFAAIDRADRLIESGGFAAKRRGELLKQQRLLTDQRKKITAAIAAKVGEKLKVLDRQIAELKKSATQPVRPEFGYHSRIAPRQKITKWVQVDLGKSQPIRQLVYVGSHDTYANIGAGFGFPVRYKIEASDDADFKQKVHSLVDHTAADVVNPGVKPQTVAVKNVSARYVRMTATKLAVRRKDYIFALAELAVLDDKDQNVARGKKVTSLDSVQAAPRWQRKNLVDGYYLKSHKDEVAAATLAKLQDERRKLMVAATDKKQRNRISEIKKELSRVSGALAALPKSKGKVYAATTRKTKGRPRPIHVLHRGSVKAPGELAVPGAMSCLPQLPGHFELPKDHREGLRRRMLAAWIVDKKNPLTWRSIVNRVWQYHFGRGLVETPNDFGRMGQQPSHPKLLDYLAADFRDTGQSLKSLHRKIVTSAVYRQSSIGRTEGQKIDPANTYLWRMNRRRLEAEAIRDSVLSVSGKLDTRMYGPGFHLFVIEKPQHSPHYLYEKHNVDDPRSHRRSVYRFIVRSVPDPFMTTFDCADPSQGVARRDETLTALQALALLNNRFMVRMAEHFAERAKASGENLPAQVTAAYQLALGRDPAEEERAVLVKYAKAHGLPGTCRVIFNLNEFIFVD